MSDGVKAKHGRTASLEAVTLESIRRVVHAMGMIQDLHVVDGSVRGTSVRLSCGCGLAWEGDVDTAASWLAAVAWGGVPCFFAKERGVDEVMSA